MRQLMQGLEQGKPPLCSLSWSNSVLSTRTAVPGAVGWLFLAFPSEPPADGQEGQDV